MKISFNMNGLSVHVISRCMGQRKNSKSSYTVLLCFFSVTSSNMRYLLVFCKREGLSIGYCGPYIYICFR